MPVTAWALVGTPDHSTAMATAAALADRGGSGSAWAASAGVLISARISPFAQCSLDEALSLAIGLGRVGPGEDLAQAQTGAGCPKSLPIPSFDVGDTALLEAGP
jgi:hypothetical protein